MTPLWKVGTIWRKRLPRASLVGCVLSWVLLVLHHCYMAVQHTQLCYITSSCPSKEPLETMGKGSSSGWDNDD